MTRHCGLLCVMLLITAFLVSAVASANIADQSEGLSKGKGKKSRIVQVDLNQLPPELAKQLQRYLSEKPQQPQTQQPKSAKAAPTGKPFQLPPGLAKKPADHPGRKAFLAALQKESATEPASKVPGKGKSKGPDMQKMPVKTLPPGLQNKPADHPGRRAFLARMTDASSPPMPSEKSRGKGRIGGQGRIRGHSLFGDEVETRNAVVF